MPFRVDGSRFTTVLGGSGSRVIGPSARINRSDGYLRAAAEQAQLKSTLATSVKLREALTELRAVLRTEGAGSRRASAQSSPGIALDLASRVTTRGSTEEVNRLNTSVTPRNPAFDGSSTSTPTVGGAYDGSQGSATFTVEISNPNRTVGGNRDIRLTLRDSAGVRIDRQTLVANTPADTEVTFNNGVTVSLSAGTVRRSDTFSFDVEVGDEQAVDPDNPLGGSGSNDPLLETGQQVLAGTFEVNGVTITVDPTTDSLNDVLDQITASAAGVDATFDAATETVQLSRRVASDEDITLTNDTSGFLAATKLAGSSSTLGQTSDADQTLSSVAAFAGVSSGTLQVNGVDVAFDVTTDTVQDLVARIGSTVDGVTASMSSNRVVITAQHSSQRLELQDGGTGILQALQLRSGVYTGTRGAGPDSEAVIAATREVATLMGELLAGASDDAPLAVRQLYSSVEQLVRDAADEDTLGLVRTGLGVDFDFREGVRDRVSLRQGGSALRRTLTLRSDVVESFFGATEADGTGFLDKLVDRLEHDEERLKDAVGSTGIFVSATA